MKYSDNGTRTTNKIDALLDQIEYLNEYIAELEAQNETLQMKIDSMSVDATLELVEA